MRLVVKSRRTYMLAVSSMIIVSLVVVYSLTPASQEILLESYHSDQSSRLFILGTVAQVLNGNLDSTVYFQQDASHIAFAVGAGTPSSVNRTGEMLIFDGRAYIKPADPTTNYAMLTSTTPGTPFCFGLEEGETPSAIYTFQTKNRENYTLSSIYQLLTGYHSRMFAIFGIAEFTQIDRTALKLAPTNHESITAQENRQKYFLDPPPINQKVGIFFGIVNDPTEKQQSSYDPSLESKIFYTNPAEKISSQLLSHTHILVTTRNSLESTHFTNEFDILQYARTLPVEDINHLLTQSTLNRAVLIVYEIVGTVSAEREQHGSSASGSMSLSATDTFSVVLLCDFIRQPLEARIY